MLGPLPEYALHLSNVPEYLTTSQWRTAPQDLDNSIRDPHARTNQTNIPFDTAAALQKRDTTIMQMRTCINQLEHTLSTAHTSQQELITNKVRADVDTSLKDMISDIATLQLTCASKVSAATRLELRLREREREIMRLEHFLSEGQKQFLHSLEERGLRSASALQIDKAKASAEGRTKYELAQQFVDLHYRTALLDVKEQDLAFRDANFLVQARAGLEARLKAKIEAEVVPAARLESYYAGFSDGKVAGMKDAAAEAKKMGMKEGYEMGCKQAEKILKLCMGSNMGGGAEKMEFEDWEREWGWLVSLGHAENPFRLGATIGGGGSGQEKGVEMMDDEEIKHPEHEEIDAHGGGYRARNVNGINGGHRGYEGYGLYGGRPANTNGFRGGNHANGFDGRGNNHVNGFGNGNDLNSTNDFHNGHAYNTIPTGPRMSRMNGNVAPFKPAVNKTAAPAPPPSSSQSQTAPPTRPSTPPPPPPPAPVNLLDL